MLRAALLALLLALAVSASPLLPSSARSREGVDGDDPRRKGAPAEPPPDEPPRERGACLIGGLGCASDSECCSDLCLGGVCEA